MDKLIYECEWWAFLDICEKVIELAPPDLKAQIESDIDGMMAKTGMQWQIRDGRVEWRGWTPLFAQRVSKTRSLLRADPKFQGPAEQFEKAYKHLSTCPPDAENCIKDAIGAIEGVARIIQGSSEPLSKLLDPIAKRFGIHPAIKEAISKLYAYRGDEQGIAYGATQPLKVGTEEAELVLHCSVAIIVYLLRKRAID